MLQLFICQVIHRDKITSALLFFAKFLKDLTQTAKSLSVGCVFTRLGISELNTKAAMPCYYTAFGFSLRACSLTLSLHRVSLLRKASSLRFNCVTGELNQNPRCARFSVTDVFMFKKLQFNCDNLLNE